MTTNKGGFQWQNWDFNTGYKTNQWRSTVSAPSCAFCQKSVFPAEEVQAAGQKFHKLCLKCTACQTLLNPGNLTEHEKKIYCSPCYRRQFGPRGVGRGLSISISPGLDTPPNSPSVSRMESYRPQRTTSTGSSSPSRASSDDDSRLTNSVTYLGSLAARTHIPPVVQRSIQSNASTLRLVSSMIGNICPRCSKTVYSAEEVKAIGKSFHKRCYTCANCKGSINAARYSEHEGEIYDNNCYQRLFGPKGIGPGAFFAGK